MRKPRLFPAAALLVVGTLMSLGGSALGMSGGAVAPVAQEAGTLAGASAVPGGDGWLISSQMNHGDGYGVISSKFEKAYQQYDSVGADSFHVPSRQTWTVKEVDVLGFYAIGTTKITKTWNVVFYSDDEGQPGQVLKSMTIKNSSGQVRGNVTLANIRGVKLAGGNTYWLSVQANRMKFNLGLWYWGTRAVQRGSAAMWENPGDGFASGCTTWGTLSTCIGSQGEGPDFLFALRGVAKRAQ